MPIFREGREHKPIDFKVFQKRLMGGVGEEMDLNVEFEKNIQRNEFTKHLI